MTNEGLIAHITIAAINRGLTVNRVEIETDEFGFVTASLYVKKRFAYQAMRSLRLNLTSKLKQEVRDGYYDAAIGYDDVPAGLALLQFDCFTLPR